MCSEVSAVVLAGGYSRRMGQDKAALRLGGKTLLQHTVDKLRAVGIEEILVSGWQSCPEGTVYVSDIYPHRGPLSGIHAGLLAASNSCALILPVDMPLLSEKTLHALIAAQGAAAVTILEEEPLPGVFDKAVAPICETLLQGKNYSLHRLLEASGTLSIPDPEAAELRRNCNTPEDFREIQQLYRKIQRNL